ncbi:hypothetical protein DB30_01328 [Enhygromyxa salina]|uniref:Uncharacterized protein n=1 Tax=Enhygromyxa salina TaxID=215803 RepID=A0A0C2CMM3_9BACT|nr:hypothetical protein DB30_01328 [Enhygromyxa salina]
MGGPSWQLAESLVHETAHQYYYFTKRLGPLVDPNDTDLYMSSLVGRHRPIEMVLAAWHAAANIVCLHTLLLARRPRDAPPSGAVIQARADYLQLTSVLKTSRSLSLLGEALFWPMEEWIRHSL